MISGCKGLINLRQQKFENKMTTCFLRSCFKTFLLPKNECFPLCNKFDIIHCHHPLKQIVASFAEIRQHENLRPATQRKRRRFRRVDFSLKSSIYRWFSRFLFAVTEHVVSTLYLSTSLVKEICKQLSKLQFSRRTCILRFQMII